jgi:hypothetical protein
MKLYILSGVLEYDYSEPIGVYESRELALQAVARIQEDDQGVTAFDFYQIATATLGAAPRALAVETIYI